MGETRPSCVKQPEHVNSRGNWGGASQERLLGGGDTYPRLVLKEAMLVNCVGGSSEGLASQKGKLARAMTEKWDDQGVDWDRGELGYEGSGGRGVPI